MDRKHKCYRYRIHTDAIKENLIPKEVTKQQAGIVYASEADLLNVALFGITAKEWRDTNPGKSGNNPLAPTGADMRLWLLKGGVSVL